MDKHNLYGHFWICFTLSNLESQACKCTNCNAEVQDQEKYLFVTFHCNICCIFKVEKKISVLKKEIVVVFPEDVKCLENADIYI